MMTHAQILTPPAPKTQACTLVWLRRDLRLEDHAAIARALTYSEPLQLVFIFDETILAAIPGQAQQGVREDRRVAFIHAAVAEISDRLQAGGGHLLTRHGDPRQLIPQLAQAIGAVRVVFAHDDEPEALARDADVQVSLAKQGITTESVKDQCIFERSEVLTGAGTPFSVFTPYKNAWLKRFTSADVEPKKTGAGAAGKSPALAKAFAARCRSAALLPSNMKQNLPSMASLGFSAGNLYSLKIPLAESGAQDVFEEFKPRIGQYKLSRDFPGAKGPSYLSVHLRFGTISIRQLVRFAMQIQSHDRMAAEGAATWCSELIWREFYMQILHHHPHVVSRSFKREYDAIVWASGPEADDMFAAWCEGRTGYPLVDAGMRQLNATGYMHNRLRMVVASFLTKDLGIDWRKGERYFAWKLNDYDLSANNGGWQWAASTGCDAQPYFRIFNPVSQSERFDPQGSFIRRYVPEIAALPDKFIHSPWTAPPLLMAELGIRLGSATTSLGATGLNHISGSVGSVESVYPMPIVDHGQAREKTLMRFSVVKNRR